MSGRISNKSCSGNHSVPRCGSRTCVSQCCPCRDASLPCRFRFSAVKLAKLQRVQWWQDASRSRLIRFPYSICWPRVFRATLRKFFHFVCHLCYRIVWVGQQWLETSRGCEALRGLRKVHFRFVGLRWQRESSASCQSLLVWSYYLKTAFP